MALTPPEWGSTPEDVSKIIVRHLDLAALARFGAVCRAWQQVAASPESWEELHMSCWGDMTVLEGCCDLVQSFKKRWHLLCELPEHLWRWATCANQVTGTSAMERQAKLEQAKRAAELALSRARHCPLALEIMVSLTPATLEPAAAQGPSSAPTGDSLQTKWVRYTIGRYLERVNAGKAPGDLVLPSADTCALFARAARHAHWLVQTCARVSARSRDAGPGGCPWLAVSAVVTRCLQDDRLRHGWLRLLEDCTSLEAGDSGPLSAVQRERDAGAAGGGRMEGSTDDAELMTRQGSGGRRAESESEGGQGRAPLWRRECELVERGAFLISTIEAPELEQEALSRQLDDIAGKVRARMRTRLEREGADPDSALEVDEILKDLNFVLFEDGGFHGNEQDYYDPKNSYLHQVLARKTGIPISLSVLYMCVAARLGIKMVGVNAPGHFLLRCYAGPASKVRMLYIDVFNSGHCLDSAALHVMLHRLGVREDRWEERLPTTRPRDLFARMLRNLVVAHRPPDDLRWEQLRAVAESVGGSLAATGLTSAAALLEKRSALLVLCLAQLCTLLLRSEDASVQHYEEQVEVYRWTGATRILHP